MSVIDRFTQLVDVPAGSGLWERTAGGALVWRDPAEFVTAVEFAAHEVGEVNVHGIADTTVLSAVYPKIASGAYRGEAHFTNQGFVNNRARFTPVFLQQGQAIDRIAARVTAAGVAGSVLRVGIADDDGTARPGNLLYQAVALLATDAAPVTVEATITFTATYTGWHWLVGVNQNATGVGTLSGIGLSLTQDIAISSIVSQVGCWIHDGVAGAFPPVFAPVLNGGAAYNLRVRGA